eukprot:CAMPEP_0114259890 /NCGR_PEP_ID=MMETSP0058-20121206/20148_1 /TAXON_ID=36894 /ORGANISM="Pyramimonas parkeae, CCMP726" /LENGTH=572 /DNA_ID=CAMNT_0001374995 /DNA_START=233 /DNA_END=1951 /DNA_ORIENTATION=-
MALDHSTPHQPQMGAATVFAVVCNLPPGVHQYKFIVDGEWRHDEGQPYMPDPLGNVNNWIFVGAPGAPPTPAAAAQQASPSAFRSPQPAGSIPQNPGQQLHEATMPGGGKSSGEASSGMDWTSSGSTGQTAPTTAGGSAGSEAVPQFVTGGPAGSVAGSEDDPQLSRSRLSEFLHRHTAYELIPESGKVVVLDTALPVQQAFHALYEQGLPSAPLWDQSRADFVGIISASDFITILHRLRHRTPALSAAELEQLTIARWRRECQLDTTPLVLVRPEDSLRTVTQTLLRCGYKSVPVLAFSGPVSDQSDAADPADASAPAKAVTRLVPQLLHLATFGGILSAVARHFHHTPAALPLLSQPLANLRLGTFTEGIPLGGPSHSRQPAAMDGTPLAHRTDDEPDASAGGAKGRGFHTLSPNTPLTEAMARLLQTGVASLPVVDANGTLIDIYARSDVVSLARDQAYSRLPLDEITVSQAIAYCHQPGSSNIGSMSQSTHQPQSQGGGSEAASIPTGLEGVGRVGRAFTCTRASTLRVAMEALAHPDVRRLVCVDPSNNRVEGIVSLRDVVAFLCRE